MKVKIFFNSSYPVGNVSTHRVHNLARGLVENGADVEVIIVHPTENQKNILNNYTNGNFEGVNFRYINNILIRRKNILIRKIIDLYCHVCVIFEVMFNKNKPDVNIIIGPSLDFRTFLALVNMFNKSKIFLEINEYPFLKNSQSILSRLKRNFWFRIIVPFYDGFIAISSELDKLMSSFKSKNAKNIIVPILGNYKENIEIPNRMINEDYIIHSGSLYEEKDGVLGILKVFNEVIKTYDKPLKLVITGNSKKDINNKELFEFIKKNNLNNYITFTGFVSTDELNSYMQNASLAIINKYDNLQNKYCFSTKLADYISNNVPIIITSVGEAKEYMRNLDNAYVVEPEDHDALVEKVLCVLNNKEQSKLYAKSATKLILEDFNYKYQGQRLLNFLKERTI